MDLAALHDPGALAGGDRPAERTVADVRDEVVQRRGGILTLRLGEQTPVLTGYYAQTSEGGDVYIVPPITVAELERLLNQPFAPTPTPAPTTGPTSPPTPAPTAPPIGAPTSTPVPTPAR